MFEELIEQYQKLPIESKREKILEELKLIIAMLQFLCDKKNIKYKEIKINELMNLENDSLFLDAVYSYITSLKEQLGNYIIDNEEKK